MQEGKHFFEVLPGEVGPTNFVEPDLGGNRKEIVLLTQAGYLLLVKSFKDDPECLAMFREAMAKQGERNDLDNNVIYVDTPQGNSRAYSIDRVKRECEPVVQ